MRALAAAWLRLWAGLRSITGDDAYDRYLGHCRDRHPGADPLDRAAFYCAELERRWKEVNRCC